MTLNNLEERGAFAGGSHMRYVVVAGRIPRGLPRFCTFCCEPIESGYTRDITTALVYCQPRCAELHANEWKAQAEEVRRVA